MTWDEINKLLRSELSAVETYQQALPARLDHGLCLGVSAA
jgi:hypothetical protein